ncbi:3-phosphoshikimate 1-carboxyvinyltransferase [Geothrix sp.]|uniref:3-phosphoshikimate 1-carboxyvinyltransferase n=1 Tax=Geothrix sp. TaxID=1962974 RepID=UPI0025BA68B7|nr:3-phosphoshikimate 1-carboxyvinyltransferase [Geothrix sp.]WIL20598.1 MAG: 3-phosphoshikimate 1-carboxyvinyltransferase [Geothrix sp.]
MRIPGSKSVTNRALLLAALAPGTSHLQGGLEAEDTRWMRQALRDLGIPVVEQGGTWGIQGGGRPRAQGPLWLGASGTTLRFLLPWLALCAEGPVRLEGDPRLFERPLGPLLGPLEALGAQWSADASGAWLRPSPVPPGRLELKVDARLSSQFLSGLALAAAGLPGPSLLTWEEVASPSYLTLTTQWLRRFSCGAILEAGRWQIPGGALQPRDLVLPGDWSGAAAFLAAAGVTGRRLQVSPLDPEDAQGDRTMVALLEAAGCAIRWLDAQTLEVQGPLRRGLDADLTDCPDLGPVLAALAALAPGPSELRGLHTLPLKECDRLDASAELVRWLGGQAEVIGDHTLRVAPGRAVADRSPFNPRNDHRMAFAAALGGLRWGGDLLDPHCVAKTFPDFWEVWRGMLGC